MTYPSFNKISTGPGDDGLFWKETTQPNWWIFGVRIDGVDVDFGILEVGEFDYGRINSIRFKDCTHLKVATTSEAPPELIPNHLVIAP